MPPDKPVIPVDNRVLDLLKKKISNLTLLLEINKKIVETSDFIALMKLIMETATTVVNAEASALMLIDEKTNELVFDIAIGDKGDQVKTMRLKMGEGIAGTCAQNGESILVADVTRDTRWFKKADEKSKFVTKSILCVPLKNKEKVIGIVEVLNHRERVHFNNEDKALLEAFSSQVAVALANAKLIYDLNTEKGKLTALFDGMSDAAILLDADYRPVTFNKTAKNILGLAEPAGNMNFIEFLRKDFQVHPDFPDPCSMSSETTVHEMSRKEGKSFYLTNSFTAICDRERKMKNCIMVIRDVTSEKKEELLKRNFLSLISHKLKTPLTVISGFTQLMKAEMSSGSFTEVMKESVDTIYERTLFLIALVQKLLSFKLMTTSSVELSRARAKLGGIIEKSLENLKELPELQQAKITVDPSIANIPEILCDEEKVIEACGGLIENAVKFNAKEIKTLKIYGETKDNKAVIYFEDNGNGIPPEEKNNLFQKFYQIDEHFTGQVEGVGLGLSLIRHIVELHGGKIDFTSRPGSGTTFFFSLPL